MNLTRDQILAASDRPIEAVDVPEWGGTVHVKTMSGSQRDRFEAEFTKDRGKDIRARLAAYALCDEAGNGLFSEADIKALGEKSTAALQRVFDVALRLNAVSTADIDELAKN